MVCSTMVVVHVEDASASHLYNCVVVKVVEWDSQFFVSMRGRIYLGDVAVHETVPYHLLHKVKL